MSTCSNCFNNCSEITSDKCVKYTGVDIELLGIKKGDSLSYIEQTIIGFLISTLDGTGIKPNMNQFDFCALVSDNLPDCGDITILNIEQALSTAICTVNDLITQLISTVDTINSGYSVECLTSETITDASLIHEILQTLIDRFCILETNFIAFTENTDVTYVKLADLNALIQVYLNSISASSLMCNKMVPYTVVEYYGPLSGYPTASDGFNGSGAGVGAWANVYLCNGDNGTPDKRGRVGVGCTNMLGTVPLDAAVDPGANPNNPIYALTNPAISTKYGANYINLSVAQLASHTHVISSSVTDPGHIHYEFTPTGYGTTGANVTTTNYPSAGEIEGGNLSYAIYGSTTIPTLGKSSTASTGITVGSTATNTGNGDSHNNVQPSLACNYIIYLP